jgi:hypothetical protein
MVTVTLLVLDTLVAPINNRRKLPELKYRSFRKMECNSNLELHSDLDRLSVPAER